MPPIHKGAEPALLPCPFCGGEASLTDDGARAGTRRQSCIVTCRNCGARHESSDDGDRSGESWNTRAALRLPQGTTEPAGWKLVPIDPTRGLLISMAMRWDHSFGMDQHPDDPFKQGYTPEGRESIVGAMRQIHEEVVGTGFYQPDREDAYQSYAPAAPLPVSGASDE